MNTRRYPFSNRNIKRVDVARILSYIESEYKVESSSIYQIPEIPIQPEKEIFPPVNSTDNALIICNNDSIPWI